LANPKLRGVLADLPSAVAGAAALRTGAIAHCCELLGIEFFAVVQVFAGSQDSRQGLDTKVRITKLSPIPESIKNSSEKVLVKFDYWGHQEV
jgi:hypothetical protein